MSLEGLNYLLDKSEVVATASALDLRNRPESIETGYLRHVRTFVPMSRFADGGTLTVEDFEKRIIKRVNEGRAPRGYIAAGYGYGKTSTALYLWRQAEEQGLLAVPPFQLEKLSHLIDGLYGWSRYRFSKRRPAAVARLDEAYAHVVNRSLESMAKQYGVPVDAAAQMLENGSLNLDAQPNDYVGFFELVTRIALEAGYSGVLLIADEIQQFIRPRQQSKVDVLSPFFNILQLLGTREADSSLNFGLVLSITLEEIAMIRDVHKRGDLLARLRELSIDLTEIYTRDFARVLWEQLAESFDFSAEAPSVIDPETLAGLGNICSNREISDGPRTVVNALKRAVTMFLERRAAGIDQPYSPIDLMDDFLDEQKIYFAGNDRVRSVTRQHLSHPFVTSNPLRYSPAIKLIAAYGAEGVPAGPQAKYDQTDAIAELMEKTIGEVVRVGSNLAEHSVALVGLNAAADPSWMKETIRNFRLGWNADSRETKERTFAAFTALLTKHVFPKARVIDQQSATLLSNYRVILELDTFGKDNRRMPKRRVHIRLLWDDEPVRESSFDGDACLEYRLNSYSAIPMPERRSYAESVREGETTHTIHIPLNLYYTPEDAVARPLYDSLKDVWSPYELSPIILLNLYQLLFDLHQAQQMPKQEADFVFESILPELLGFATTDLFNAAVGAKIESAGPAISDYALRHVLGERYPNYHTFMSTQMWSNTLGKYKTGLERLESPLQRRGDEPVEMSKDALIKLLNLSSTGFDSFAASFTSFIGVEKTPKGTSFTFKLHPLEQKIIEWLNVSEQTVPVGKLTARRIPRSFVIKAASELGYLPDEIGTALELLAVREMVALSDDWITEAVNESVSLESLKVDLDVVTRAANALNTAFPSKALDIHNQEIARITRDLNEQRSRKHPESAKVHTLFRDIKTVRTNIGAFAADRISDLRQRAQKLILSGLRESDQTLLEQVINDEVGYADKINVLRVELTKEVEKIERRRTAFNDELQQSLGKLRPDVNYHELVNLNSAIKDLEKAHTDLQSAIQMMRTRIEHYQQWRALAKDGAGILRDLHELRLDGADAVQNRFKELTATLRGEISARKIEALADHEQFRIPLDNLRNAVNSLKQNARTAFNTQRDVYVMLLKDMGVRPDDTLAHIQFNPSDPDNVYALVVRLTHQNLSRAADELLSFITSRQQTMAALSRQEVHLPARERRKVQQALQSANDVLQQLAQRGAALQTRVSTLTTETALKESVEAFAEEYRSIRRSADEIRGELDNLRKTVAQLEPTETEARLLAVLTQIGGDADLFALQVEFSDDGDEFWSALRGLVEKDYVKMSIRSAVTLETDDA